MGDTTAFDGSADGSARAGGGRGAAWGIVQADAALPAAGQRGAGPVRRRETLAARDRRRPGAAIEARGAHLLDLPPHSPDLNPIEQAFAKLKALLRTAARRTLDALWHAIGRALDAFSPVECGRYLAHAGYAPSNREPLASAFQDSCSPEC